MAGLAAVFVVGRVEIVGVVTERVVIGVGQKGLVVEEKVEGGLVVGWNSG
jgi:hypothetical protein